MATANSCPPPACVPVPDSPLFTPSLPCLLVSWRTQCQEGRLGRNTASRDGFLGRRTRLSERADGSWSEQSTRMRAGAGCQGLLVALLQLVFLLADTGTGLGWRLWWLLQAQLSHAGCSDCRQHSRALARVSQASPRSLPCTCLPACPHHSPIISLAHRPSVTLTPSAPAACDISAATP